MKQPLEGVRVVDLSRVLAGPYCTMILGDLGAEIIKIEAPGGSDETRDWRPPETGGESAYYLCANRNKRGITLNLKSPEGREVLKRLVSAADILIENFKTGTMDRLGLGYEELKKINPGLVYCSITGFGITGPYKHLPGYDYIVQAMGGVMSFTGPADGEPTKVGVAIADVTAGLNAVIGILAALRAREHTGEGDRVDISLLDSQVSWLANVASNYLVSGQLPKRYGNQHPNIVPYQVFHAKDLDLVVAVGNDRQFERFCQLIGKPEWAEDPAYSTNKARLAHRDELVAKIQEVLLIKDAAYWLEGLMAEGIPCGPINTLDRTFSDPQVLAREMVIEMAHPTAKSVKLVGSPLKLTNRPVQYRLHPPLVGEHTQEVLAEHGYTEEAIRQLQEKGAI